jgi:hypothetical protein
MRSIFIQSGGQLVILSENISKTKQDAQMRINGKGDLHIILKVHSNEIKIYSRIPLRNVCLFGCKS